MSSNASGDGPVRTDCDQELKVEKCSCNEQQLIAHWKSTHVSWQTFNELRKSSLCFDVILRAADGQSFPAHRLLLCTCSQYFKTLFSGRWKSGERDEIELPGVNSKFLETILDFVYTRELTFTCLEETKELLIVANHLGSDEIVHRCVSYLLTILCVENCLDLWTFSRIYQLHQLTKNARDYILCHITDLIQLDQRSNLWDLCYDDIRMLLESNELNISDEKTVFCITLRWVSHDLSNRRKLMRRLLACTRWGQVDEDFVIKAIEKNRLISSCSHSLLYLTGVLSTKTHGISSAIVPGSVPLYDKNGNYLRTQPDIEAGCAPSLFSHRYPRSIIFVVGGWCDKSPTNSTEAYEPRSRRWSITTSQFPQLLQRPRAYHAVVYLDGYVYVIGGFDGGTTFNACEQYDIKTKKWQKMSSMHTRRCYVGVATLNGLIYAIGGSEGNSDETRLKSAETFDPERNVWIQIPNMMEQRSDAGVCGVNNRVYAAGGFTGRHCLFSVEFFDVNLNQWTLASPMRIARSGVCVVPYRDRIMVLGGFDGSNRQRTVDVYHPGRNTWSTFPPMLTKRSNFAACVIDEKLTVLGGFNGISTCANVEYFNDDIPPDTDAIHESFAASTSLINCDATENRNESVLEKFAVSSKLKVEIMNTGKWTPLPSMSLSRSALSSCVVEGLSPSLLQSIISGGDSFIAKQ